MACNICLDQLLEPDPADEFIVINSNGAPGAFENGTTPIPVGASSLDVGFGTVKISTSYTFHELAVVNTTDISPLTIQPNLTSFGKLGFSVSFSGATDTGNYKLRWEVEVTEI